MGFVNYCLPRGCFVATLAHDESSNLFELFAQVAAAEKIQQRIDDKVQQVNCFSHGVNLQDNLWRYHFA